MTSSFHDTRWTLVSRSRVRAITARAALSELCAAYYAPVVAFLRREGRDEDTARELAHDFFARLLGGGEIEGAQPERGRFRSYLLGALKHFAADQRDRSLAKKRGGGVEHEEIIAGNEIADAGAESPDAAYDRQWALTVLARAMSCLESEMREEGKGGHFDVLKPWLTGGDADHPQSAAASELGISEDAVKMAVHRLRKRFRESVKAETAQTVSGPESVREELAALMAALRQ
jgi:RNA polymerase sigma factor (sigma-70 family)